MNILEIAGLVTVSLLLGTYIGYRLGMYIAAKLIEAILPGKILAALTKHVR